MSTDTPTEDGWYWARWNEGDDFVPTMFVDGGSAWKLTPYGTPVARESSKIHEWGARLLAAQAPRPVPEGDRTSPAPGWQWCCTLPHSCRYLVRIDGRLNADGTRPHVNTIKETWAVHDTDNAAELAARIEALEAENARLREDNERFYDLWTTSDAENASLSVTIDTLRAAQSAPSPTVDSGVPSGLDETTGPHCPFCGSTALRIERTSESKQVVCECGARGEDDGGYDHDVVVRFCTPKHAAASATLVAERDALAEKLRDMTKLRDHAMQDAAAQRALGYDLGGAIDRDQLVNAATYLYGPSEAERLFPAGPRAEREQADGE